MMSVQDRFPHKSIILAVLFFTSSLFASGWFTIYENGDWPKINGVAKESNGLNTLYAVGNNGAYYFTYQGGYDWETLSTGTSENLLAIATAKDNGVVNHVAVGENGTVLHYNEVQDNWQQISGLGSRHYHSAYFDDNTSTFWIGGENGQLQVSLDYGATWQSKLLDSDLKVLGMATSYDGILLITDKNDTTFVLRENTETGLFSSQPGDTLAGISLKAAIEPEGEYSGTLYILGLQQGIPDAYVYELPYGGASTVQEVFSGDLGIITDLAVWGNDGLTYWITTEGGAIWESRESADNWKLIYTDQQGKDLGPILSSDWEEDPGRVFGSGGLVLKYGFELHNFWPEINRNISANFNQIELNFSLIPDMSSVERGVWIDSDQRGLIPFSAEYDASDSSIIWLDLQSAFGPAQIPGERLNITFTDSLKALNAERYYNFRDMNYDLTVVSNRPSSFQFNDYYHSLPLGKLTTNWVNGFINRDDILDFVTFTDDTLYCFMGSVDGNYEKLTFPFTNLINVRVPSAEQLILQDLNQDGLPDLILYDENDIFILRNESTPSDIIFSGPTAQQQEEVINKLVVYNADNDPFFDLMILGTRFVTLFDIDLDSFGSDLITHESGFVAHLCVDVADLNGDGQPDMILIDNDGQLVLREGNGYGSFDDFNQVYASSGRGYTAIKAANLNDDHRLEILAYNSTYIDLIVPTNETQWSFRLEQESIISTLPDLLVDLYIQDFGGSRDGEEKMRPDVIALTPASILFYENQTLDLQNINFVQLASYSKSIEIPFDKLLAGDYDQDGTLDFTACDLASGQFDIWNKFTWQPVIEKFEVSKFQVTLDWTPFPVEAGEINYYKVYRSDRPEWDQYGYIRQSAGNHFIDYEMRPYATFWYAVQAVYNGGIESDWSKLDSVQTFNELNGPQSGVLDDTSRFYLAKTSISVEAGNTLEIKGGVRIGFEQDTRFDVYGSLIVAGSEPEQHMVDFESANWDSSVWDGIYLHPGADTVRFDWFSIMGAETGLQVDSRPLKMHFGGIIGNQTGLLANGDTLSLENVVFDSNAVAIRIQGTTHAHVKNVNIFHSQLNSIVASNASMTLVRNAIIWDNHGPVIKEQAGTFIRIKYSTVDSMEQNISRAEISRLAPVFVISDTGQYYQVDYLSPTIDAGDPGDAFDAEPLPNGGRINQGLYGGSPMATPSFQPRISVEPGTLYMVVRPGYSDTSAFWIKNPGGSNLQVNDIEQVSESSIFQVLGNVAPIVLPGDSVQIQVVFAPELTINYLDTLQIRCNDPHLADGIKDVALFGRGSDVVPVVQLDPLPDATLRESAVRFWYNVADSGSQSVVPSASGTYTVRYSLVRVPGDTVETGFRLTESPIDFFPLDDGLYKFKIWANPEPGNVAAEVHAKTQYFTVHVKTRTSFPLRWYMVSLPRGYPVDWKWFGQGDSSAYLLRWDNDENDYLPLNTAQIEPGQAFWAFPIKLLDLDLALLDNANPFDKSAVAPPFQLVPGWNQIGAPSDFSLFWSEMQIIPDGTVNSEMSFMEAVEAQIIEGVVYRFIQSSDFTGYDWNVVDSTTKAEPWAGYWLKAQESCTITFPEMPAFNPIRSSVIVEPVSALQKSITNMNWQVNLSLENEHYTDRKNILGIGSDQTVHIAEPPHIGDYCALYIPTEKGNLTQSIYPAFSNHDDVKVWDLKSVTRNTKEAHSLSWNSAELAKSDVFLYLVDLQSEEVLDMRATGSYIFNPKGNTSLFRVYASQDENFRPEIVPLAFKLEQNFPNPFNPQTTIRFGVPLSAEGKQIRLTIYDVLGKKITELYNGNLDKGYHQIEWNGRNALGKQVASGIYFYRLQAGKTRLMKKMVLVR